MQDTAPFRGLITYPQRLLGSPGWPWIVILAMFAAGCSSQDEAIRLSDRTQMADTAHLQIIRDEGRPIAVRLEDGREVSFEGREAVVGDWVVIAHDDGRVETHRAPNAIMTEASRLPYLYLEQDTRERVVTHGHCGTPYVNPATGHICWPALTCENPQCPGRSEAEQPYLFVSPLISGASVGADGKLHIDPHAPPAPDVPACPACKSRIYVKRYELPEEIRRHQTLTDELASVRRARDRANQKKPTSDKVR